MFNVYKTQLSRQTESRNLTGPKTLPTIWDYYTDSIIVPATIWHTYMKLVTKFHTPAINSCGGKCDEKYLGRTEGLTDKGKPVFPLRWSGGIKKNIETNNRRQDTTQKD